LDLKDDVECPVQIADPPYLHSQKFVQLPQFGVLVVESSLLAVSFYPTQL
jgi:hypothetical protein